MHAGQMPTHRLDPSNSPLILAKFSGLSSHCLRRLQSEWCGEGDVYLLQFYWEIDRATFHLHRLGRTIKLHDGRTRHSLREDVR